MRFESDEALMEAVSYGRKDAFEILVDRYMPVVSRTALRILCDQSDSELVTRSVFRNVWWGAAGYDGRFSLSVWMYRITFRLCLKRLRRNRFLDFISESRMVYETSAPQSSSPEEDYITKEAWEIFCRATREMSLRQRTIFALCELEGLSHEELQAVTGLSADSVEDNLRIARSKVISELEAYGKVM